MKTYEREAVILERVRQDLLAEGYEVVLEPNRIMVPAFLGGFRPDALAFGKGKNLVVEIASQNSRSAKKVNDLKKAVEREPDWDLKLVWISASETPRSLPASESRSIFSTIEEIDDLIRLQRSKPAFLLLWAVLEALGRRLLPLEIARPQSPRTLVEKLAREGLVTPDDARILRDNISRRNRLVHGDLKTEIRPKYVAELRSVVASLMQSDEGLKPKLLDD